MSLFKIELLNLTDVDNLVEIEKNSHISPWNKVSFTESILNKHLCWGIKKHNAGSIIAYIVMSLVIDELQILNLTVAATYRRQGYGLQLLKAAYKFSSQNKIKKIFLEVRISNLAAISLYKHYGFYKIGCRVNYYSHPSLKRETALVMAYDI